MARTPVLRTERGRLERSTRAEISVAPRLLHYSSGTTAERNARTCSDRLTANPLIPDTAATATGGVGMRSSESRPSGMAIRWRRVHHMPAFVLRLIAPRPNFAQTLTESERAIMNSHAAHWRPYLERGDMVVFGPVLTEEDSYGLAVVETDDEQALRDFALHDPVLTSGTAAFE